MSSWRHSAAEAGAVDDDRPSVPDTPGESVPQAPSGPEDEPVDPDHPTNPA
jgi:hypothetical protein